MVAGGIEERIKKMKEAILTEARQRADQIVEDAQEEGDQERAKIYNAEKQKINNEHQKLKKDEKVKNKIEKSSVINRERIKVMTARYEYVQKMKIQVNEKLRQIVNEKSKYKDFTKKLIVQGMLRMMQRNVSVQVKKDQCDLAKSLFSECQKEFTQFLLAQTGHQMQTKLNVSDYYLEDKKKDIIGGVNMRSSDGLIVCDNSIDARVGLLFEHLLPQIRALLFPKNEQKTQNASLI